MRRGQVHRTGIGVHVKIEDAILFVAFCTNIIVLYSSIVRLGRVEKEEIYISTSVVEGTAYNNG